MIKKILIKKKLNKMKRKKKQIYKNKKYIL